MTTPSGFGSVEQMIAMAMEDAGLIQSGQVPNSEQYANGLNRFNMLLTMLQIHGLKVFTQTDQSVTLVTSQGGPTNPYTIYPSGDVAITKPLQVLQAYYMDSNNLKRPIDPPMSRDEYTRLSNPTATGAVTSYFIDKQPTLLNLHLWLVPDATAATGTVHLILRNQITRAVALDDAIAFPDEWYMAVRWGLADDLCTGQPQAIMDRCAAKALAYRTMAEDFDVEDVATRFQPDTRMNTHSRSFR